MDGQVNEIRGKAMNENLVRTSSGEEHQMTKPLEERFVGKDVVIRGDNVTMRLDS
jgi:small nuclear ribonucleoprotein (snRNP)-like protein